MKKWLVVAVLSVVAVGLWLVFRGDPDLRAIRKAFDEVVEAVQFEGRQDILPAGLAARRVSGYFTDDASLRVKGLPVSIGSRTDLQTTLLHLRTRLDRLQVTTEDVKIELADDRASAEMFLTARVTAEGMGEAGEERRALQMDWRSTEDGWKISGVRSYETIR